MQLYFLKEPSKSVLNGYGQNIQSALRAMKAEAEKGIDRRISSIAVTDGCNHGCRFCFFNAVPLHRAKYIGMEAIQLASETLGFVQPIALTGGEPLDHPNIVRLLRFTRGHLPTTNGFSLIESEEECVATLRPILRKIQGVSFNVHDTPNNPGRILVMKQLLLHGITPEVGFVAELGEEEKLLRGWIKTLHLLVTDPELRTAFHDPKVRTAFLKLFGMNRDSVLRLSLLERSGKGANLEGLDVRSLSMNELIFENGIQESVHYTLMLPNGDLIPNLFYYYLAREPGLHIFANICDPLPVIQSGLQHAVRGFLAERLARDEDDVRNEVHAHYENADARITSFMFFFTLLKKPEIRSLLQIIKDEFAESLGLPSSFTTLADVSNVELDAYRDTRARYFIRDALWYIQLPYTLPRTR